MDSEASNKNNFQRQILMAGAAALLAVATAYVAHQSVKKTPLVVLDFDPSIVRPNYVEELTSSNTFVKELNLHASFATQIFEAYPDYSQILKRFYIHRDKIFQRNLPNRGNYMDIMENLTSLLLFTIQETKKEYFLEDPKRILGTKQILKKALEYWGESSSLFTSQIKDAMKKLKMEESIFPVKKKKTTENGFIFG